MPRLVSAILLALPSVLLNPFLWVILIMIGRQEARLADLREKAYGQAPRDTARKVIKSLAFGCVCGLAGSIVFVGLGLSLDGAGLGYIWPAALALMLIDSRFICFSYAGGLLSLLSLTVGWPQISVPQVICLVAVLHLVESLLIYADGSTGAVPVVQRNTSGRAYIVFVLQRFWPVPVVVLSLVTLAYSGENSIKMPEWWPLIKPPGYDSMNNARAVFGLFPVLAALGYGDMASSKAPKQKARWSAGLLSIYSIVLLVLGIGAQRSSLVSYIAAVFAIVGHESIIRTGLSLEKTNPPLFINPPRGLMVADVLPHGTAYEMGLRSGDILRRVNYREVNMEEEVQNLVYKNPLYLELEVDRLYGNDGISRTDVRSKVTLVRKQRGPISSLGVLFVPRDLSGPTYQIKTATGGLLKRLFKR